MGSFRSAAVAARSIVADTIRGITRCVFALATLGAWVGILSIGQGKDVIRRAVERAALDDSFSELVSLAITTTLLGLSIWYAMRCLLGVQMPGLPMAGPRKSFSRTWLPRIAGAVAVGFPAWVIWHLPPGIAADDLKRIHEMSEYASAGFTALAAALLLFLERRTRIFKLGRPDTRAPAGTPLQMAHEALLPAAMVRALFWSLAVMCLCSLLLLALPLSVPRVVGSAPLVALALAGINLFGSFVLTFWPLRGGLPPLAPWVLGWAVLISPLTDNHGSQLIVSRSPAEAASAALAVASRPSVAAAYQAWLDKRARPGQPTYVVATEGGGSRAAYWTAAVLERLSARDPEFEHDVFAISAVSGGSVGAGFWVAGLRSRLCPAGKTPAAAAAAASAPASTVDTDRPDVATRALTTDFLSPAVNYLLFADLMQRFVPYPMTSVNRSRGLEQGWQRALSTVPGKPLTRTIDSLYADCAELPELLLNSTDSETGRRDILSHLDNEGFVDVLGFDTKVDSKVCTPADSVAERRIDPSTDHQSLAGLMLQSARFPVVSPAGSVIDLKAPGHPVIARLVDGGYFDNSGIVTALEAIAMMKPLQPAGGPPIVLIVITDSAYAECKQEGNGAYCNLSTAPLPTRSSPAGGLPWVNEIEPIIAGVYNVRNSHLRLSLFRALSTTQVAIVSRDPGGDDIPAPTGWALSRGVTDMMARQAKSSVQRMQRVPPAWPGAAPTATAASAPSAKECP